MNGFLNLLKPPGMSSGTAVAIVKRWTREKVGHAGTLDPEAAGVLPVMVGRATRLLDCFPDKSKSYTAEIAFSGATDTQDAQGTIIQPGTRVPARQEILDVLSAFRGDILQCPPAYSALKRDGKPLYALARKGEMVQTEPRPTQIRALELGNQTREDGYMLTIDCGSGTYIRTLCHDIGQKLGAPAHMRFLLRTRAGAFDIEHAVTLEEAEAAWQAGELEKFLLPLDTPLMSLKRLDVPDYLAVLAKNGGKLPLKLLPELQENERCRVYLDGQLVSVSRRDANIIHTDVGLVGGEAT